jgi:hypothetical protein
MLNHGGRKGMHTHDLTYNKKKNHNNRDLYKGCKQGNPNTENNKKH